MSKVTFHDNNKTSIDGPLKAFREIAQGHDKQIPYVLGIRYYGKCTLILEYDNKEVRNNDYAKLRKILINGSEPIE